MEIKVPTFIKWAGGKQQLLPKFSKYFPATIINYVEPFVGGGATFFYILKYKKPISAKAYDINADLINLYSYVRDNAKDLIDILKSLEDLHNNQKDPKKFFINNRIEFNEIKKKNLLRKAALFIYLNKTCFNGLYRVNADGEFNVPFNGKKKIKLFETSTIYEAQELLNIPGVIVKKGDFRAIKFYKEDTVYFDPPYWSAENEKKKSREQGRGFTNYTKIGFNRDDQISLSKLFFDLATNGNKVLLSNSDTNFIRHLYSEDKYTKHSITARRIINCDGKGRSKIKELLITANITDLQKHL